MWQPELFPTLPSFVNIKAILVDLDGTLVDSHPSLKKAYREFLYAFSCEGSQEEFDSLNGPSLPEVVAFLKQKYQLEGSQIELQALYEQGLIKAYKQAIQCMPHAKEALTFAKKECGLKLALVTSAERKIVEASLQGLKFPFDFDAVACMESGMRSKPSPDLYQKALQQLNMKANETLAIEDALNGVLSATGAGIFTLQLMHDGSKLAKELGDMAIEMHGGWPHVLAILQNAYPDSNL